MKTETITIRISKEDKAIIKQNAKKQKRSLANYLTIVGLGK